MDRNLRPYIAELIGTFAVVFVSAGAVISAYVISAPPAAGSAWHLGIGPIIGIALAQGLILAAALAITVPIAGGYLNPALTLMLYVFKRFELGKTVALIVSQVVGALLAGALIRVVFGMREDLLKAARLGTPHVDLATFGASHFSSGVLFSGLGVELIGTFLLAAVVFGTFHDPRAPRVLGRLGSWLAPLWIGLVKMAVVLVAFAWTGAALNPARYFGTALWELTVPGLAEGYPGVFDDHMVYWIGPIVGALLAGAAYVYLILPQEEEPVDSPPVTSARRPSTSAVLSRTHS